MQYPKFDKQIPRKYFFVCRPYKFLSEMFIIWPTLSILLEMVLNLIGFNYGSMIYLFCFCQANNLPLASGCKLSIFMVVFNTTSAQFAAWLPYRVFSPSLDLLRRWFYGMEVQNIYTILYLPFSYLRVEWF